MKQMILVTGLSGAGKTTYSQSLDFPTLHLDKIHNYGTATTNYKAVEQWMLENDEEYTLVMDAWVLYQDLGLGIFRSLCAACGREVEVRVIYTTPLELYLTQQTKLRPGYQIPSVHNTLRKHAEAWKSHATNLVLHPLADVVDARVRWFFRSGGTYLEYPDSEHFQAVTGEDPAISLLAWVDAISFDPTYQTIDLNGDVIRKGYSKTEETWKQIQTWNIGWAGKTVMEIGCFHGYFCRRVEEAGATKIIGYDRHEGAIEVSSCLAGLASVCRFERRLFPESRLDLDVDIMLVLNVLHHIVPDAGSKAGLAFLTHLFFHCREIVFEVERDAGVAIMIAAGNAGFHLVAGVDSHRKTSKGVRRLLHWRQP